MIATRRLAAILAADVAGYSRLIGADEEGTLNRLRSIQADISEPTITEYRGRIVRKTGDGLLIEFSSVVDGLRSATQWQRSMAKTNAHMPRSAESGSVSEFTRAISTCRIAGIDSDPTVVLQPAHMGRLVVRYCAKDA
jgi:class 3 adenylate cyclase